MYPRLDDGHHKDASWFFKWALSWITVKITLYVIPALLIICAGILATLYIYLWLEGGLLWLVGFFALLILARYVLAKLVAMDDLELFYRKPGLYRGLVKADQAMVKTHRFLGRLHLLHRRAIVWSSKKYWGLPTKWKVATTFGVLAVAIPLGFLVTERTYLEVKTKLPYGIKRHSMTPEQLLARKANRITQARFAVWGKDDAAAHAKCMEKYKTLIYAEAIKNGITPERFEGLLFVESSCRIDLVNAKSGAAGMGQLMLSVGCEQNLVMSSAFCSEAKRRRLLFIPKELKIEDRRLNPTYAIPVSAGILGDSKRYWNDENWAFVEYHMGMGNLRQLVMNYLDETAPGWRKKYPTTFSHIADPNRVISRAVVQAGISYDDIFFRSTPDQTPKTYRLLFKNLADSSATYVYTGLAATEGLALMRNDSAAFQSMIKQQQDPDGGIANRPMRAWWSNAEANFHTRADIISATKQGGLVSVPNNGTYGFVLRTSGANPIGECDKGNESTYYVTRKATAGLIYLIGARTKELGADNLEVTGLIRTNQMYENGCLPNTQPRTHVIGSAFDIGGNIAGKKMPRKTREALEFVIMDLRADGVIDRIKEGTADHISYNPAFEKELEAIYDSVMAGNSPLTITV